ncbi:hypothetical protein [Pseudoclavibacter sp. 13-3]|uniref:hypothetical protein n=1 Tax=Pseudoclavibacter sp. 13-3 TaxID=2901228 RepID=UPI001E5DDD52|nr:hypothetical protein [Pseudoclavibacter sp. 13-3]MCD7102373.1 hypothetical protein [Pseudoclavibacter sp. 13-3]
MRLNAPVDIELRDRRILIRTWRSLVTWNPADWFRIAHILHTVITSIDRWDRWRDTSHDVASSERLRLTGRASSARRLSLKPGLGSVLAWTNLVILGVGLATIVALLSQR